MIAKIKMTVNGNNDLLMGGYLFYRKISTFICYIRFVEVKFLCNFLLSNKKANFVRTGTN